MSEPLQLILQEPNPRVIEVLERLLAQAHTGELRGVVILCAMPAQETAMYAAGENAVGGVLAAFEDWKMSEFAARNLRCGTCGNAP